MNGDLGNHDELNIEDLRGLFTECEAHCNNCFEEVMEKRGLKFESIADEVFDEVGFLKWKCVTCERVTNHSNWY